MTAYCIHDTDGGRHEPRPLLRHIYATEQEAIQVAKHRGFDAQYYPVLPVRIEAAAMELFA